MLPQERYGDNMERIRFKPVSEEETRISISKKIAYYRKISGLTQVQLSKLSGISVASIQRIEQGHDSVLPGLPTLIRLMNSFEREMEELFY